MPLSAESNAQDIRDGRRSAARAAIMEAGRTIASRNGADDLSLSSVAAEAGFNPSTVFGYFRNKDELLLAIVAEDLGSLAGLMRDQITTSKLSKDDQKTEGMPPPSASSDTHADGIVPARVDAWLERRLRVFEHALADIEQRLNQAEAGVARAVSLSEHGAETLFQRMEAFERHHAEAMESLTQRFDEAERRQRGVASQMRAAMNDAATRIEVLEASSAEQQLGTGKPSEGRRLAAVGSPAVAELATSNAPEQDAYLAAAHRAADAAAALADIDCTAVEESAWHTFARSRVRVRRRHYLLAACVAFIAFAVGGFAAFYIGQARGREMIVQVTARAVNVDRSPLPKQAGVAHPRSPDPRARLAALARAGSAHAELLLGLSYLRGDSRMAADQSRAVEWILRAAQQHEPIAQYWLGSLYEHGDGVPADSTEAVRWYEAAARQGNRKAMHALGVLYAQGIGIGKNYSAAATWFARAAALGLVNSEFNLGVLYERGLGVPQNLREAYKWYAVAAAQGDEESRSRIETLETQLRPQDIAAARHAADVFQPRPFLESANNVPELAALSGTIAARQ